MTEVRYTEEADIEASPESVYEYRLDYERNLPAYNPNVSNMKRTDGGAEPGVGASYRFDVEIPNMGTMESTLTVLEAEQPTRIVNEMGSGAFRAQEVCTFTPRDSGTHVTFAVTVSFPDEMAGVATLAEESGRDQVRQELDLMKKNLES